MMNLADMYRELGTVGEMWDLAGRVPMEVGGGVGNNAHVHLPPNFSAFGSVGEVVELAAAEGCRVLGASNYYDFDIYEEFALKARERNVFPLFGVEIMCMVEELKAVGMRLNDPGNPGKLYLCGKGLVKFGEITGEAGQILGLIRKNDSERMARMVEKLSRVLAERGLANDLNAERVIEGVVRRHGVRRETVYLQERHVAQAVQEFIFAAVPAEERMGRVAGVLGCVPRMKGAEDAVGLQNEIRGQLMKAGKAGYVEETFIGFKPAMKLIREMGGFACNPILADGAVPMCEGEASIEGMLGRMKEVGLFAAELITGRNSVAVATAYAKAVRGAGIVVTCGTEHNTGEKVGMVPKCADGEVPGELKEIFYEGACVVAAHQFLVSQGEAGYADGGYKSGEGRIGKLARLGNAVIRRYLERGRVN